MSSFSHLSATSHNSNNGNPKKTLAGGPPCLTPPSGKWRAGLPGSRTGASAAGGRRPEVGAAAKHKVLARETGRWKLSFGASEESIRALFETHGTVSLRLLPAQARRWSDTASRLATCARGPTVAHRRLLRRHSPTCYWPPVLPSDMS